MIMNATDTPLVSIVIPVFNKWSYTAKCLDQLARNTTGHSYEVIVVDNASSDETERELSGRPGIRVHRNNTNLGFSRACNQGAGMAVGKYLLFLNNDTEPRAGWLEPMVRILEEEPEVGIVGSKLLFPDGTLQHAGVHIGTAVPFPISPYHLDYRKPAGHSTRRRDLEAVTGACLAIRSELFSAVDGFDEAYVNGCEDIDLCLKVREMGNRVVYTPESVLVHHESVSDGRFLYVSENLIHFHKQWMHRYPGFVQPKVGSPETGRDPHSPGVSIILVTRDSLSTIAPCLEGLAKCAGAQDEIIIVDEASQDGTMRFIESFKHRLPGTVRVVQNPTTEGHARSANLGLRTATRAYALLLRPVAVLMPGCLERMVGHLERNPSVAAVGPLSTRTDGLQKASPSQAERGLTSTEAIAASRGRRLAGRSRETRFLEDFCLLARREALAQVGNLDAALWMDAHDLDLCQRLVAEGHQLRIIEDAFVLHLGSQQMRERDVLKCEYLRRQSANLLYEKLYRRHDGRVPSSQELWGVERFRPQTGLASIVMLVHNNLALTRICIESVYRHTHREFELILVDNGSREPVAQFAEELQRKYGNVVLIRNEANEGYAFGTDQGLAAAQGEFVVLLNNDVVVTPGWLGRQIALLSFDPKLGIVGPRASNTAGPQQVETVGYQDVSGLERFAEEWFRDHAGELVVVPRLTGLCMVIRRELLDVIGGLDTTFGIGNYEDDDFCLRAQRAGYMLAVAGDVFIHHYGSATFRSINVDYATLMEENARIFRSKWEIEGDIRGGYPAGEVIASRPFDPALDHVPVEYARIFSPDAPPLDIGETRPVRMLCIPDWDDPTWKDVFAAYLHAFGPSDPVSLILRVEPPLPELVDSAFQAAEACLRSTGIAAEEAPEIVFEASRIAPGGRGGLYTAATLFLPTPGSRAHLYAREARTCGLPSVDAPSPERLRAAVADLLHESREPMPVLAHGAAH